MTLPTNPSLDVARLDAATAIKTAADAWLAVGGYVPVVEAENRTMMDLGSPDALKPFLTWEIKFRGGGQASLGKEPLALTLGQIIISSKVKEGSGTSESLLLLNHVIPFLEAKELSVIRTNVAETYDGFARQGWYFIPVIVNFWFHRIVPS